jgi:hypothetical protein
MSIAAGRGWLAAGQGLNNIGALLLQQQELQREHARQDAEDQRLAFERARQDAEFADRTGISSVPASAPRISFNPPAFGTSLPSGGAMGAQAQPGLLGSSAMPAIQGPSTDATTGELVPRTPAPVAARTTPTISPPLTGGIGRIALGETAMPPVRGLSDTFQPGGFIRTGPSAADRTVLEKARTAGAVGQVRAGLEPAVAAMSPQAQTLVGAGDVPEVTINRAQQAQDAAAEATAWRDYWSGKGKPLPTGLDDEAANRMGRYLFQQANDTRPATAPGDTAPSRTTLQQRMRARAEHLQQTLGSKSRISGRVTLAPWNDVIARMRQDGEFGNATSADWQAIGTPGAATPVVPGAATSRTPGSYHPDNPFAGQ